MFTQFGNVVKILLYKKFSFILNKKQVLIRTQNITFTKFNIQ